MARQKQSPKDNKTAPEVTKSLEFVGLFTRVAKVVGVTPSHAIQVAKGRRKSKKVIEAIVTEVRKIERHAERAA